MIELTQDQTEQVAGGLLGNLLYQAVYTSNQILNTPLISSVGQAFNQAGPAGVAIHQAADTGGYAVFRSLAGLAGALGGGGAPIPYHYDTEWK